MLYQSRKLLACSLSVAFSLIASVAMAQQSDIQLTGYFDQALNGCGCASASGCCDSGCSSCCDTACQSCGGCGASCGSCGCCDCGGCDCGGCCGQGRLFGLFAPSDHGFSDFISPMTNPVFFEDPRTLTEARLIYLHHKVPGAALGGNVDVFAMQIRAALTERLSIIATKDGYAVSNNPLIDDGWADITAGLKYNLYRNYEYQQLLSVGLTYELPTGSQRTLQGNGDGTFNMFVTGGAELLPGMHWISASGFILPVDTSAESQLWFWSNHFDQQLTQSIYFLTEFNWYHWMKSGDNSALSGVEGGDLFNLGSTGVAGNDIVTGAFGLKFKPSVHLELGVCWEVPLTQRRDVLENRLTVDCILRY